MKHSSCGDEGTLPSVLECYEIYIVQGARNIFKIEVVPGLDSSGVWQRHHAFFGEQMLYCSAAFCSNRHELLSSILMCLESAVCYSRGGSEQRMSWITLARGKDTAMELAEKETAMTSLLRKLAGRNGVASGCERSSISSQSIALCEWI